jgi:hypothetical protein
MLEGGLRMQLGCQPVSSLDRNVPFFASIEMSLSNSQFQRGWGAGEGAAFEFLPRPALD